MWPQIQPLQRPVKRSEEACLESLFRGDLKGSHYSFEFDLSLCMCPPATSVQRISVPLRMLLDLYLCSFNQNGLSNMNSLLNIQVKIPDC